MNADNEQTGILPQQILLIRFWFFPAPRAVREIRQYFNRLSATRVFVWCCQDARIPQRTALVLGILIVLCARAIAAGGQNLGSILGSRPRQRAITIALLAVSGRSRAWRIRTNVAARGFSQYCEVGRRRARCYRLTVLLLQVDCTVTTLPDIRGRPIPPGAGMIHWNANAQAPPVWRAGNVARPPGLEPGTHSLEGCCSIHLS